MLEPKIENRSNFPNALTSECTEAMVWFFASEGNRSQEANVCQNHHDAKVC